MHEKKSQFDKINKLYLPRISRLFVIFGISLLFIQYLIIPALAESTEYYEGYNVITYDDGSKDIISGALNFLRWDGVWRPNEELNISNGSWPFLVTENAVTADFRVDDDTLSIPKANTKFIMKENSISQVLEFPKSEFNRKQTSIDLTSAFIGIPYTLKSRKSKNKYEDKYTIEYGRFKFKAGKDQITIHDNTLREYIEDGKVFQDYTYLFEDDYDFIIENGEIRLKFEKKALDKLMGNIIIEIHTWHVDGPYNWGNVVFSQTKDVKATGNVELRQKVDDYVFYTRFDEGNGKIIHNENTSNVLLGELQGVLTSNTWVTNGKYGKAIYFNGIDSVDGNRVLFENDPGIRLPGNFVISLFLYNTGYNNPDTDIIRKGSTSTADAWNKIEVGANKVPDLIYAYIEDPSSKVELKDPTKRWDSKWHFITLSRTGTKCSLMVDRVLVTPTKTCSDNTVNTAQLSIGAKDSDFPDDYIEGLIDEVRMYDHSLTDGELTSIQNNEHIATGTITRDLSNPTIIPTGYEIKELGCHGIWDRSVTKVDVMASANNVTWDTIQSNAFPSLNYTVLTPNNYKYFRCSLSTTTTSQTPILQSMGARIDPKVLSYTISVQTDPQGLTPSPLGGGQYTSGQTATVTAQTVFGYNFQKWTENGGEVSTSAAYSFEVTGARTLVAVYTKKPTGTITGKVNRA